VQPKITIEITSSVALVLFEGLAQLEDQDQPLTDDPVLNAAFVQLHASLEKTIPELFRPNYADKVKEARRIVGEDFANRDQD
jgi:hypothetical protein